MNKNVLITGCSSGIGFETALYLAQKGFQVYAGIRNAKHGDALQDEARRRRLRLEAIPLDIVDSKSIHQAVERIVLECGQLYALVNNAGIQLRGFFEDLKDEEIRRVFETNVFGTMAVIRSVLPHMRTTRRGRIVIMSSIGGVIGSMTLTAYCAAKFALEGFGESLAQEVKPFGIRVILVEPGIIKTPIWSGNRGIAEKASAPESIYRRWFAGAERLTDSLIESSRTTPLDVAQGVHRSLSTPSPRLRYMIGTRAKIVTLLRRYAPERIFESIYFGGIMYRVKAAAENNETKRC